MEDKHICTDVTSPLWKSCQFEAVRDWDRPGLCNVVRRSSSKTTFSAVCKHFSSLCKKTPAGARAPSVTSANFRHPRATVARSESLDCKDENRFFSWSEAKAIKKQFFLLLHWRVWDPAAAAGVRADAVSEDGTVRGEMRRGGQRNSIAAQAFCPELSLHTWTGAGKEDEYGNYVQTPLSTHAMSFK